MRATTKRSSRRRWPPTSSDFGRGTAMRRVIALVSLLIAGALSMAAGVQDQAAKTVKLRTLGPGDNLYVLIGGGGNTLAMVRDDGVVLIDTKLPGWGRTILDALQAITDRPVITIINTHAHG